MKNILFWTGTISLILLVFFLKSKISLNGYRKDFYFLVFSLIINSAAVFLLIKNDKQKANFSFGIVFIESIALIIFIWAGITAQRVYTPKLAKDNMYAGFTLNIRKAYFKKTRNTCNSDGVYWETKVPTYFPIIEIETKREKCFKIPVDTNNFKLVPE